MVRTAAGHEEINAMSEPSFELNDRIGRIRGMAAYIVQWSGGKPTREVLHALALATGALINKTGQTPTARQNMIGAQVRSITQHVQQ